VSKTRLYVYLGDSRGTISVWHLTEAMSASNIFECPELKLKSGFQLLRKQLVNAQEQAKRFRGLSKKKKHCPLVHSQGTVLIHS